MSTPRYDMRTAHFDTGAVFVTSSWERYDATNDVWSNGLLSDPRIGIAVAQAGTKAYFAGGKKGPFTDYIYVKSVDVYDDATHAWSKTTLSAEREVGGAGALGSKVFLPAGAVRSPPVVLSKAAINAESPAVAVNDTGMMAAWARSARSGLRGRGRGQSD